MSNLLRTRRVKTEAEQESDYRIAESFGVGYDVADAQHDAVNHPKHYTDHPSGVECIQITEHMNFCLGNAIKYLWRAGEKGDTVEDLQKAVWYINREIERIQRG